MILTTKEKLTRYAALSPRLEEAFRALAQLSREEFRPGRHEVSGDAIYINAAEYDTHGAETAMLEAHRVYIDVMWMISGEEELDACPLTEAGEELRPYRLEDDALLARLPEQRTRLRLGADSVCILFPEDAHAPGIDPGSRSHVRKLIAKVAL